MPEPVITNENIVICILCISIDYDGLSYQHCVRNTYVEMIAEL